jgi:transcriptional regulator with XRE-family HTH domain
MLGVQRATYGRWERDQKRPAIRHLPRIVGLLGLRLSRNAETLPERLRAARQWRGLTQGELAALVGVDRRTLGDWERGVRSPGMEGPAAIRGGAAPACDAT